MTKNTNEISRFNFLSLFLKTKTIKHLPQTYPTSIPLIRQSNICFYEFKQNCATCSAFDKMTRFWLTKKGVKDKAITVSLDMNNVLKTSKLAYILQPLSLAINKTVQHALKTCSSKRRQLTKIEEGKLHSSNSELLLHTDCREGASMTAGLQSLTCSATLL